MATFFLSLFTSASHPISCSSLYANARSRIYCMHHFNHKFFRNYFAEEFAMLSRGAFARRQRSSATRFPQAVCAVNQKKDPLHTLARRQSVTQIKYTNTHALSRCAPRAYTFYKYVRQGRASDRMDNISSLNPPRRMRLSLWSILNSIMIGSVWRIGHKQHTDTDSHKHKHAHRKQTIGVTFCCSICGRAPHACPNSRESERDTPE